MLTSVTKYAKLLVSFKELLILNQNGIILHGISPHLKPGGNC